MSYSVVLVLLVSTLVSVALAATSLVSCVPVEMWLVMVISVSRSPQLALVREVYITSVTKTG